MGMSAITLGLLSSLAVLAGILVAYSRRSDQRMRDRWYGHRLDPMVLGGDRASWSLAPVHAVRLLIHCEVDDGLAAERIIRPQSILGRKVRSRGVCPDVINAYCEAADTMKAYRFCDILWAADARSGEFIQDLYGYFGGAQPGGAPAPATRLP